MANFRPGVDLFMKLWPEHRQQTYHSSSEFSPATSYASEGC